MTHPGEPLKVDPNELRVTADRIDGHATESRTTREMAHARAGSVRLGSGSAAAALPAMLAAWEADGVHFEERFHEHAHGHRTAAPAYSDADVDGANEINDAGAHF